MDNDHFSPKKLEALMSFIVVCLVVGYIALSRVYHGSLIVKIIVGALVVFVVFMMCRIIYIFDKEFNDKT